MIKNPIFVGVPGSRSKASILMILVLCQTAILVRADDREKAVAAVVVARAQIAIADDQPSLPASAAVAENVAIPETNVAIVEPIRFEVPQQSPVSYVMPAQLVVRHWARGCARGDRQVREIERVLKPLRWSIGDGPENQIQIVTTEDQSYPCPTIELYQNGVIINTWQGLTHVNTLSAELRSAWESAGPSQTVAQAGPAGAIQGRKQIHDMLTWWRANIGERVKATARWDRTGAQSFPLLAKGDWSIGALCGKYGHVEAAAKGSKYPIDAIGFGYRVAGDDVTVDLDPVTIKGLKLSKSDTMQSGPSEFGPGTLLTVLTVVRGIYSLLHPTCDLQLGGTVSATGVLNGDTLAIDFENCPSIKLVALFTFQLAVKRLEIKKDSVRVLFTGSRLVKERTFAVQ
jgi:hypothetical protein